MTVYQGKTEPRSEVVSQYMYSELHLLFGRIRCIPQENQFPIRSSTWAKIFFLGKASTKY